MSHFETKSNIFSINTIQNLEQILLNLNQTWLTPDDKVLFLIDIDDTVIKPKSNSVYIDNLFIIDYIKKLRDNSQSLEAIEQYNQKIAAWRKTRTTVLTEPHWPEVLNKLKVNKNYTIYALTSIDTGKFYTIPSMEQWRYDELSKLNISFTNKLINQDNIQLLLSKDNNPESGYASFYNGIILTGKYKKSEVLSAVLDLNRDKNFNYNHIVFIDDRLEKLHEISDFCKQRDIACTLVHYLAANTEPLENKTTEMQKKYLLEKSVWIEEN